MNLLSTYLKYKEHLNTNHLGNISASHDTFVQKKARFEVSGTLDKYWVYYH